MADESPSNSTPVAQVERTPNRKPLGIILLVGSIVLPFLPFVFSVPIPMSDILFLLVPWLAGLLGAGFYARSSGRSLAWVLLAVFPVLGPLVVLGAFSADSVLSKFSGSNALRLAVRSLIVVAGIGFVAAVVIPNFLNYPVKSRQSEARMNLGKIWLAEQAFYEAHKRYGTFEEIGFKPVQPTRYTFRIDQSGKPGTVILGTTGQPATSDNSMVPAGFTATGFTATATANIDNDPIIDQWHVNDAKQDLKKADVDDARN